MYYGKKKKIIIAIVIILIVIILGVVGTFLFLKTDLFKSNKTLFWKYAIQNIESKEDTTKKDENQIESIEKMKMQKPYTTESTLSVSSTDEKTNKMLEKLELNIKGENDNTSNYSHTNAKIKFDEKDLFSLDYAKSNDIYALKSDEIVTMYLGIKNENLNVLAQKLGIKDDFSIIPEGINSINFAELFKISDQQLKNLSDTYKEIIIKNIPDNDYSKQTEAVIQKNGKSYKTTSYRLQLEANEISNLIKNILDTLKTDNITLNMLATKAKLLGLGEDYSTIDGLKEKIEELISNIPNTQFTDTTFVVYNYNGQNIQTEIIIKNKMKYIIYKNDGELQILLNPLNQNSTYSDAEIDIKYKTKSNLTNLEIATQLNGENLFKVLMNISGLPTQGNVVEDINVIVNISTNNELTFNYNETMKFDDEIENEINLTEANCAILNNFSKAELDSLIVALGARIQEVFNSKIQTINNGITAIQNNTTTNNATTNNTATNNTTTNSSTTNNNTNTTNEMPERDYYNEVYLNN